MIRFIRKYLSVLVMVLTLIYAVGDHYTWWDNLRGRTAVLQSWDRLTYSRGGEPLFDALSNFIADRSRSDSLRIQQQKGLYPTAIARLGGTQTPDIGDHPSGWPEFREALQTSPIVFIYGYTRSQMANGEGSHGAKTFFACTLRDLRDWVNESRSREWFLVSTLFIGLLSLAVAIHEKRTDRQDSSSST